MALSAKMVTKEFLMCAVKTGLKAVPVAGHGFDAAFSLVEGLQKRHESLTNADRLAAVEAQMTRVEKAVRDTIEEQTRTILKNLSKPDIPSQELTREMREFLQIQKENWSPHLFEGFLRNSRHWDEFKKNPNTYGDVLDDHDPIDPSKGFHLLLDADKTRVIRMKPPALAMLLERQAVGIPPAEIKVAGDIWAFPATGEASKAIVTPVEKELIKPDRTIVAPGGIKTPAQDVVVKSIGLKMKLIPAGEFQMGSPPSDGDAGDVEKPQHKVHITRPFLLGVYPVTQGEYKAITSKTPSHFGGSDRLPVENVSWDDAVAFCNALSKKEGLAEYYFVKDGRTTIPDFLAPGYRLPTEAEWEYACRGKNPGRYSFGDDAALLNRYAWYADNAGGQTQTVGGLAPNGFGLYDTHGLVWEWCWDGFDAGYYKRMPASINDPFGPSGASVRVFRGGSWGNDGAGCRSAYRGRSTPTDRHSYLGFRLCRSSVQG